MLGLFLHVCPVQVHQRSLQRPEQVQRCAGRAGRLKLFHPAKGLYCANSFKVSRGIDSNGRKPPRRSRADVPQIAQLETLMAARK